MLYILITTCFSSCRIAKYQPMVAHDMTEVRRMALSEIAMRYEEEDRVDEAMQVFLDARSNLEPYLYPDVLPCLDYLRSNGITVGLMSNGNCDITRCSLINERISFCLSACTIGAKKPSYVPFVAVSHLANVPVCPFLYDTFAALPL